MKQILFTYTKYNVWANGRIMECLTRLDKKLLDKKVISSFPTVRKTILHMWDAETIWYKRLSGKSLRSWPSDKFKGSFEEMKLGFLKQSGMFPVYLANTTADIRRKIEYSSLMGDKFKDRICNVIQHCMNHSTFHRGQIVTMLRELGVKNLPYTDYIMFSREVMKN